MDEVAGIPGACPERGYIESLGEPGILLGGESLPMVVGELEVLPSALGLGRSGHLLLLEGDVERLAPLEAFLADSSWVVHMPAEMSESLQRRPELLGRISGMEPGFSFMAQGVEVDVLPRGPEAAGLSLLLDWRGTLFLYPALLPTPRAAGEFWRTFHLQRFLLPWPEREAMMAWLAEAPLAVQDAARLRETVGAAQLLVETGQPEWRASPLARGDRLRLENGALRLLRKD